MPFWAFYMIACGALVLLGWRVDEWKAPALILLGLLGVRVTALMPDVYNELGSCAVWLIITMLVAYHNSYLAAFLLGISTIVYLPLLVVGFRIEYMGVLPVISDLFLILAIVVCGGGIFGKHIHRHNDSSGPAIELGSSQTVMAQGQERASEISGKGG